MENIENKNADDYRLLAEINYNARLLMGHGYLKFAINSLEAIPVEQRTVKDWRELAKCYLAEFSIDHAEKALKAIAQIPENNLEQEDLARKAESHYALASLTVDTIPFHDVPERRRKILEEAKNHLFTSLDYFFNAKETYYLPKIFGEFKRRNSPNAFEEDFFDFCRSVFTDNYEVNSFKRNLKKYYSLIVNNNKELPNYILRSFYQLMRFIHLILYLDVDSSLAREVRELLLTPSENMKFNRMFENINRMCEDDQQKNFTNDTRTRPAKIELAVFNSSLFFHYSTQQLTPINKNTKPLIIKHRENSRSYTSPALENAKYLFIQACAMDEQAKGSEARLFFQQALSVMETMENKNEDDYRLLAEIYYRSSLLMRNGYEKLAINSLEAIPVEQRTVKDWRELARYYLSEFSIEHAEKVIKAIAQIPENNLEQEDLVMKAASHYALASLTVAAIPFSIAPERLRKILEEARNHLFTSLDYFFNAKTTCYLSQIFGEFKRHKSPNAFEVDFFDFCSSVFTDNYKANSFKQNLEKFYSLIMNNSKELPNYILRSLYQLMRFIQLTLDLGMDSSLAREVRELLLTPSEHMKFNRMFEKINRIFEDDQQKNFTNNTRTRPTKIVLAVLNSSLFFHSSAQHTTINENTNPHLGMR